MWSKLASFSVLVNVKPVMVFIVVKTVFNYLIGSSVTFVQISVPWNRKIWIYIQGKTWIFKERGKCIKLECRREKKRKNYACPTKEHDV